MLRYMRKDKIEVLTAKQFEQPHEVVVLWEHEEGWPYIFIYPEVTLNKDGLHFSVEFYGLEGDRCVFDSEEQLWFVPDVVAKLRELLVQGLAAL